MKLDVYIENDLHKVEIPDLVMQEGHDFFDKIDRDMDGGWKMGPDFIENPNAEQRAQIVADKLMTAIETGNETMTQLLAGYIITRMPGTQAVNIDIYGEPLNTRIYQPGK
jgi:hypothetical protein